MTLPRNLTLQSAAKYRIGSCAGAAISTHQMPAVSAILTKGKQTQHTAAVRRANKRWRTAISFDDGGDWRSHRVSALSRCRKPWIWAVEVRASRRPRHSQSSAHHTPCASTPRVQMPGTGCDGRPNTLANTWPKIFRQVYVPAAESQHDQRRHVAQPLHLLRRGRAPAVSECMTGTND